MNLRFKIKNSKLKNGFTLVELLIVIAIIGILAALLLANFVGVRQRARDAQRKSDLRQIQSAMELYRSDQGTYPPQGAFSGCGFTFQYGTTVYLKKVPCDPNGSGYYNFGTYYYLDSNGGNSYVVGACLENQNDKDPNITSTNPGGGGAACANNMYYVLSSL